MLCFRRRIELLGRHEEGAGQVRAVLEDDFHHFRVVIDYRDGRVLKARGEAPRHPFSACPEAAPALGELTGMALARIAHGVTQHTDATRQCTHMFELAGLAIAAAARAIPRRRYEIEVPRHVAGHTRAQLVRDDGYRLEWDVCDSTILAPPTYRGVNMREGMARWALTNLDEDQAEAALLLRRCALIALGRVKDIDREPHARPTGRCYAQQPQRAPQAIRIVGSTWDFSDRPQALCQDEHEWLAAFDTA